jgi:hypothetical protein
MKQVALFNTLLVTVCLALLFVGCKDEESGQECLENPLNFISLITEQDTIEAGGSTTIRATADGYKLSYEWTASQGFITPGSETYLVVYSASPCSIGEITITCKVTDACDNSETKRLTIVVL